jgi:hypothetical protein
MIEVPTFITHYHYPDKEPFQNLMNVEKSERTRIARELNERYKRGETQRAFPDWYFIQREKAEKRLRETYIDRGGAPELKVPYYFMLGRSEKFEQIYNGNFNQIMLTIPTDFPNLYFSIGDSLWTFAKSEQSTQHWENQWFQGKLYNYLETVEILNQLDIDPSCQHSLREKKVGFVEALIWSDMDLQKLLEYNNYGCNSI